MVLALMLLLYEIKGEEPMPKIVQALLKEFQDVMVDNFPVRLPRLRDIQHAIYLILGLVFSNQPASVTGRTGGTIEKS